MEKIALFEKVPFAQYMDDVLDVYGGAEKFKSIKSCTDTSDVEIMIKAMYDSIKIPERATKGSAGYDFYAPEDYVIWPNETVKIPTGLRVMMEEGWMLSIFPRSGLGFKFRIQLDNTVGIIDSDYYGSDNYGHIMIKLTNDTREGKVCTINAGNGFAQGIFIPQRSCERSPKWWIWKYD